MSFPIFVVISKDCIHKSIQIAVFPRRIGQKWVDWVFRYSVYDDSRRWCLRRYRQNVFRETTNEISRWIVIGYNEDLTRPKMYMRNWVCIKKNLFSLVTCFSLAQHPTHGCLSKQLEWNDPFLMLSAPFQNSVYLPHCTNVLLVPSL